MSCPPLVPQSLRRPAVLVAIGCWVVAAALGVWYAGEHTPGGVDATIVRWVHAAITEEGMFARVLTGPTHPIVTYPVIALVLGVAVFRRWWERAVFTVAAPGLCVALTELLFKPLIGRTDDGVLSYPSGHTVSATATFAVAVLVITVDWPARWRWAAAGLLVLLWLVFAVGLVGMDYHYFTDTIGGFLVAIGVVLPLAILTDRLSARRYFFRYPPASISSVNTAVSGCPDTATGIARS
jgi:undecaprenyl-diphosphatase